MRGHPYHTQTHTHSGLHLHAVIRASNNNENKNNNSTSAANIYISLQIILKFQGLRFLLTVMSSDFHGSSTFVDDVK